MTVFVDSSALIALWNKDDSAHELAISKASKLQLEENSLIVSNIVVGEVLTVLSMKLGINRANKFWEYVANNKLKVVFVDEDIFDKAWDIFEKRTSKNLSFFDCTSFVVINEFNIDKVFSFDSDFKKHEFNLV